MDRWYDKPEGQYRKDLTNSIMENKEMFDELFNVEQLKIHVCSPSNSIVIYVDINGKKERAFIF